VREEGEQMALLLTITLLWLLTPFVSGALLVRSTRARALIARHLLACLAVGWPAGRRAAERRGVRGA
jgi:hypothetical protein